MKNKMSLMAGFVLGLLVAIAPSCGTANSCTPTSCRTGCCDAKGTCQSGSSGAACGQLGNMCVMCPLGTACNLGTCMLTGQGGGTTGGGTGGGTTGGGTGGGTTGGGTTGGGTTGGGTTGGGTTGGGTTGGGGGTCDGCFVGTMCISLANSGTTSFCGRNGVTCATCGPSQTCSNYQCVGGTGGGTTGGGTGTGGGSAGVTVGMACTADSQCTGLGAGAKCKLQTTPFGSNAATPYPTGASFCTIPCTGSCPTGSECTGGVSSYPYLFNDVDRFCSPSCTSSTGCPSGLVCAPSGPLTVASNPSCFLAGQGAVFTGGGNPTKAGNACANDNDCANPPDPVLANCITDTTFPNGYCMAASDFAPADTWCDAAGKTEVGFGLSDGGTNWNCLGTCNTPGSVGTSRAGYTCYMKSASAPTVGVLWPKCNTLTCTGITLTDGGASTCNTTSGFCCPTATSTTGCVTNFE